MEQNQHSHPFFLRVHLILLPLIWVYCNSYSQSDSTTVSKEYFIEFAGSGESDYFSQIPDSALPAQFFYDPAKRKNFSSVRTGSPGSAHFDPVPNAFHSEFLHDGFNPFRNYLIGPVAGLTFSPVQKRITNIDYHLGSRKEQHIYLTHHQVFKPWWQAGLDFGGRSSQGDFARQLNTNRNFRLWHAYESPGSVYRTYLGFSANRVLNQENGGIVSDSVFENASSLDTRTLPIYLRNAESKQRTRDYALKQELNISNLLGGKKDSTTRITNFPKGILLAHDFQYSRRSFLFNSSDPDSGYFDQFLIDSLVTADSVFFGSFHNTVTLGYAGFNEKFSYRFGGGLKSEWSEYYFSGNDTTFERHHLTGFVKFTLGKFSLSADLNTHLSGDFNSSWNTDIRMAYDARSMSRRVFAGVSLGRYPQSLKNYLYHSNHFSWVNDFKLLQQSALYAGVYFPERSAFIRVISVFEENSIYYDWDARPVSSSAMVAYGRLEIRKQFDFGKLGLEEQVLFSYTGNKRVANMPAYAGYIAVYYKDVLFKNALRFKAGADVSLHQAYNAYGYMPATGIFYQQEQKKIGDFPMAGVFIELGIKTATLMIRLDHFNAGIGTRNYYGAYHYPLSARTVKFGVSWKLTD